MKSIKLNDLSYKHEAMLAKKLGKWNDSKVKLHVHPEIKPKFTINSSLKPLLEKELKKLVNDGSIASVKFSSWAAPISAANPDNLFSIFEIFLDHFQYKP